MLRTFKIKTDWSMETFANVYKKYGKAKRPHLSVAVAVAAGGCGCRRALRVQVA